MWFIHIKMCLWCWHSIFQNQIYCYEGSGDEWNNIDKNFKEKLRRTQAYITRTPTHSGATSSGLLRCGIS